MRTDTPPMRSTMLQAFSRALAGLTLAVTLAGCSFSAAELHQDPGDTRRLATNAELPKTVAPYGRISDALACIRSTGTLHNKTFVVGAFADSTGKINQVAPGATGAFLPQGGSASYITDSLRAAGARVVSTYFGPPKKAIAAQYAVNGIFNSLDFGQQIGADIRVSGIGPMIFRGFAQMSLTIQLDEAETRLNRQISLIERPVRYSQMGIGIGREFSSTLVTGSAMMSNQEKLQLEAINGPIALGVVDVLFKEFPALRTQCGATVADLLASPAAKPASSGHGI